MENPQHDQVEKMRKTASRIRAMAMFILLICTALMISGGYVFFRAGDIVAEDKSEILQKRIVEMSITDHELQRKMLDLQSGVHHLLQSNKQLDERNVLLMKTMEEIIKEFAKPNSILNRPSDTTPKDR